MQGFRATPGSHLHEVLQLVGLHAEAVQLAILAQRGVHARV